MPYSTNGINHSTKYCLYIILQVSFQKVKKNCKKCDEDVQNKKYINVDPEFETPDNVSRNKTGSQVVEMAAGGKSSKYLSLNATRKRLSSVATI